MATDKQHKNLNVPTLRFPEFTEEWKECKLGEVTNKVGSGVTPRGGSAVYTSAGHVFIRSQNVGYGMFLLEDVAYITEQTHKKQISTELIEGDVLLNITGASIGRSAVVNNEVAGGNVNQHVCIIRVKGFISPSFICNYLLSYRGQKQIDSFQAGGNREGLNFEQIRSIKLVLPSHQEQEKVAHLLTLLDKRIATQKKVIEKLQSLIGGIKYHCFRNKHSWAQCYLKDCCSISSGYSGNQINNGKYKVTRIETISDGTINVNKVGYVDFSTRLNEYLLHPGDILFSNINSVSHIGKTAYVDLDYTLYHGMNLLRLVANQNIVVPKFLYYVLNTAVIVNKFKSICKQAVSQASINQTELGNVSILIPNMKQQAQIVEILDSLSNRMSIEYQILNRLEKQKNYLLSAMFI